MIKGGETAAVRLVLSGYPLHYPQMGTGVYTTRLVRGLLRERPGPAFRVLVPAPLWPQVAAELPEAVLEAVPGRPPIARSIAEDIYWGTRLTRHAQTRYPNAVFHGPGPLWSPLRPRRLLVTHYDCVYRHFPRLQGGVVRRWWWRASERYARRADLVLAISEHARGELATHARVAKNRIRVAYPWVEPGRPDGPGGEISRADLARRHDLPAGYLVYVGGYNCHKNVERLVAGYAAARRTAPLPPLVLAGHVPAAHPRLAVCDVRGAIAAAGLGPDQIRLIGPVAAADLPALYRHARLFVTASLHEGFGYPPAEAMAAGAPVIVADNTSLREVVRDPRCRFDATSVAAIAAKLIEANANPDAFRRPLPENFTESRGIAAYLSALAELGGDLAPGGG